MWKIVFLLALAKSGLCQIFDFTVTDNPYFDDLCYNRHSRGCNQVSTKRVSYFEGTSTLTNNNNECTYTVRTENANICQMRLDFDNLNFPNPTRDSTLNPGNNQLVETGAYTCKNGLLTVSNPSGIYTLCGNNNGQHIYVPVNASRGERDLTLKVIDNLITNNINNNANTLSWKIKITQLECPSFSKHQKPIRTWEDSLLIAPAGCLQYYLNPTGTIRNLGFVSTTTGGGTGVGNINDHYAANLNYAICFRRTPDMCGMDFNVDQFRLSGDMTAGVDCTTMTTDGVNTVRLDADYLWIPNGRFTSVTNAGGGGGTTVTTTFQDRYCGIITATSSIRSVTPGPLYIFFRTDNQVQQAVNDPNPNVADPNYNPENGWQLTYSTLYGTTCGTGL